MTVLVPAVPRSGGLSLRQAWAVARGSTRTNSVVPVIIVVAIVVLLALAVTVVAGAVVMCASRGAVLDAVVSLSAWQVKLSCHKL
ncbi:hypothetical protein [Curtobacterium sp. RRHDQ10]|uniref:hypothetical protein n=1 Tax=Curtobacterium phyllosphaerae TaxID=3413379 RepID=UPI003BF419C4